MKKTIGIFHPDFPGGGAERITVDIARYLKNFPGDYDLHVITWHLKEQYLSDDIRNTVEVTVVPEDTHSFREALAELSGRLHFDIFMQVGGPAFPFVREMADRYGTRIIFAHHNETKWAKKMLINTKEERSRESVWKWFKWIAFRKFFYTALGKAERTARKECRMQYDYSDVYTVLCDGYKREFEKWFGLDPEDNKLVVMHNPETEVKDVNLDKKNTIIYVGRLSYPDKRVDRLLRIWKRVQDRLPDYDLKIIGDGRERDRLHDMADRLRLERVSFEGYRTDIASYYRDASVSCLVSTMEGWPLSLTEAQANGVIPIAFDCCAGINEILAPSGENGFLVKPFSEKEFARTLVQVARMSEEEKLRIRHNVIKKSRRYPVEDICGQWRQLFDSLCREIAG